MVAMHAPHHAQQISEMVASYRKGQPVDDLKPPVCVACGAVKPSGSGKLLQCSACKAVKYCNKTCAREDWHGPLDPRNGKRDPERSHRETCPILKKCLEKTPEVQAIAKQFPWTRQQSDGTFSFDVMCASMGILGSGPDFGYWTQQPCCNDRSLYTWGFPLLEDRHVGERAGWKLPDKQIPWLNFGLSGAAPPKAPPSFEHNWRSYYEWRGLPIESPAALLLHWPLSAYRLLYLLGLAAPVSQPSGASEVERRNLTVYLLGVEKEIDFLPVFGELALLLPNTDLDLILFGPGVVQLREKAKGKPSLASQTYAYTYTAPRASGGGTVRISLHDSADPFWRAQNILRKRSSRPDAMIAFNAGLSSYQDWLYPVMASRAFRIPFAVTDYQEINLHNDVRLVLGHLMWLAQSVWEDEIIEEVIKMVEVDRLANTENAHFTMGLNPFMRPGPRHNAMGGGPSAVNGFEMVIAPGR